MERIVNLIFSFFEKEESKLASIISLFLKDKYPFKSLIIWFWSKKVLLILIFILKSLLKIFLLSNFFSGFSKSSINLVAFKFWETKS